MVKAAFAPDLAVFFTDHLAETKIQIEGLERIFDRLNANPQGRTCKIMKTLLEESKDVMSEDANYSVMHAALIAAAQRVEHYEMPG